MTLGRFGRGGGLQGAMNGKRPHDGPQLRERTYSSEHEQRPLFSVVGNLTYRNVSG